MAAAPYERLVAGYDGSDNAGDGLALAENLCRVTGARLLVAAVVPHEFPYAPGTLAREEAQTVDAAEMLAHAVGDSERVETRVVAAGSPAQGLHGLAESEGVDAIVVGSSHRGPVGRVLAGSVAERLLHGSPCPVAVAPAGYRTRPAGGLGVVACAFDGSHEARFAARHAESLARAAGARLRLLAVREPEVVFGLGHVPAAAALHPEEFAEAERKRLRGELERAAAGIGPGIGVEQELLEGPAAEVIGAVAGDADLLVVGSRGYGPVRRVLLGSVSSALVRSSPAPVLVVPRASG